MWYKFLATLGLFVCALIIGVFFFSFAPVYGQTTPMPNIPSNASVTPTSTVSTQQNPSIYFLDSDPLSYTTGNSNLPLATTICNIADSPIVTATIRFSQVNFNFVDITNQSQNWDQVFQEPTYKFLDPQNKEATTSTCFQISYKTQNLSLKPGNYKGIFLVRNLNEKAITKALTVTVPSPQILLDGVTIPVTRETFPFWFWGSYDIKSSIGTNLPEFPITSTLSLLDNSDVKPVGSISNGVNHIEVQEKPYTHTVADNQTNSVFLPVTLMDVQHAGNYSGTVYIAGVPLKVTYRVADSAFWAFVVILAGILVGYFINSLINRILAVRELIKRFKEITDNYSKSVTTFKADYLNKDKTPYLSADYNLLPDEPNIFIKSQKVIIKNNGFFGLTIDPDGLAFKKIDESLGRAENDAKYWYDGFGKDLLNLEVNWGKIKSQYTDLDPNKPALLQRIEQIVLEFPPFGQVMPGANPPRNLRGLAVGEASELGETARDLTNLSSAWLKAVKTYKKIYDHLQKIIIPNTVVFNPSRLNKVKAHVTLMQDFLKDVETQKAWDDYNIEKEFRLIWLNLSIVEETIKTAAKLSISSSTVIKSYGIAPGFQILPPGKGTGPNPLSTVINLPGIASVFGFKDFHFPKPAIPVSVKDFWISKAPSIIRGFGLLLVIVIACFVGLNQYYFDKPFGSFNDYVSVFVVGTGTQLSIKGILGVFTSIYKSPTLK